MWSVVEKTALAEAEVEYHDKPRHDLREVSDQVRRLRRARESEGRHLDDDPVDDPRQPRDLLFAENLLRPLPRDRGG